MKNTLRFSILVILLTLLVGFLPSAAHAGPSAQSEPENPVLTLIKNNPGMDPIQIGTTVITVITATCIVFEVVGPILCKMGLSRAGEIPDEKNKNSLG